MNIQTILPKRCYGIMFGLLSIFLTSGAVHASNPNCNEPNMLLMVDASGSMLAQVGPNSETRFELARQAIHSITQNTEEDIRYGLMLFPSINDYPATSYLSCQLASDPVVPMDLDNWSTIYHFLSPYIYNTTITNPDYFGGVTEWSATPMKDVLEFAKTLPDFQDSERRHYLALITDGQHYCSEADEDPAQVVQNRTDLVNLVNELKNMDNPITTFVIGFGDPADGVSIDPQTLSDMAIASGYTKPGCNQSLNNCYYQADDKVELLNSLNSIAQIIRQEECDGIDNDCNGVIDDGIDRLCETDCGSGYERCISGVYLPCDAEQPTVEVCDGYDNDCDGVMDEGCPCVHGETKTCGKSTGICEEGVQTCEYGAWGACEGQVVERLEQCEGLLDEDCDGYTDEVCKCIDGQTKACNTNEGICQEGIMTCQYGAWGQCVGAIFPAENDECGDNLDNDCDGTVDEYCTCYDGDTKPCGSDEGNCQQGMQTCIGDAWGKCEGAITPTSEACNLQDDDCDGQIDDDVTCPDPINTCRCGTCVGPCGPGGECSEGICIGGYCVVDNCPEGQYCDGYRCKDGSAPYQEEPDANNNSNPIVTPDQGGCSAYTGNMFSHLWGLFLICFAYIIDRKNRF